MAANLPALLLLVGALVAAVPSPASAQSPAPDTTRSQLEEVERALERERQERERAEHSATLLADEIAGLRREAIAAAKAAQQGEADLSRLESRLAALGGREAGLRVEIDRRRDQFAHVLTAVLRLARHPPEALLVHPLGPADTVRAAILLRAAVPAIEARAWKLRDDLAALQATRRTIAEERARMAEATANLARERGRLDDLVRRKAELHRDALTQGRTAAERIAELGRQAEDLRELVEKLEAERQAREAEEKRRAEAVAAAERQRVALLSAVRPESRPEPEAKEAAVPISGARGQLAVPVVGAMVGQYGQTTSSGLTRKGIDIRTRPEAQVVAPYAGRVAFSGPFRGYGLLLIIEHGEGYHSLLAGMARLDATLGQMLLAGEPVGRMGQPDTGNPVLYLELRRHGQPINPVPWMAALKVGESG